MMIADRINACKTFKAYVKRIMIGQPLLYCELDFDLLCFLLYSRPLLDEKEEMSE